MRLETALMEIAGFDVSYSQEMEDIILYRYLHNIKKGFYVDVGCHHPEELSVTKFFYERGWRGVNINALKPLIELYHKGRPEDINVHAAVSDREGELDFYEDDSCSTLSAEDAARRGLTKKSRVRVSTLTDILKGLQKEGRLLAGDIHFLKIDVEDHEREVIAGMNWNRFRPWVLAVEATLPTTAIPPHQKWEGLLLENEYSLLAAHGINRYYAANERRELLVKNYLSANPAPVIKNDQRNALQRLRVALYMD